MNDFASAVALILRHEGGYVNDPRDPGGETNFGISKRSYPNEDIRGMSRERAIQIYRRDFWEPIHGDDIPFPIALVTFDAAVNCGVGVASRWMQEALGVPVDGKIGPQTIAAARAHHDPFIAAQRITRRRIIYYTRLSTFATYGTGWIDRSLNTLWEAA